MASASTDISGTAKTAAPTFAATSSVLSTPLSSPTLAAPGSQAPFISVGYIFIPAGIIILVILIVLFVRIVPWVSWRLKKPSVTIADGVEIAYPLSPVQVNECKSHKSASSLQENTTKSRLSSVLLSSSFLSLNQQRDTTPLNSFKSSDFMIVQLDPLHSRMHCSSDVDGNNRLSQSEAVVTVGVPPSYPSDSCFNDMEQDHDAASVDTT